MRCRQQPYKARNIALLTCTALRQDLAQSNNGRSLRFRISRCRITSEFTQAKVLQLQTDIMPQLQSQALPCKLLKYPANFSVFNLQAKYPNDDFRREEGRLLSLPDVHDLNLICETPLFCRCTRSVTQTNGSEYTQLARLHALKLYPQGLQCCHYCTYM